MNHYSISIKAPFVGQRDKEKASCTILTHPYQRHCSVSALTFAQTPREHRRYLTRSSQWQIHSNTHIHQQHHKIKRPFQLYRPPAVSIVCCWPIRLQWYRANWKIHLCNNMIIIHNQTARRHRHHWNRRVRRRFIWHQR